MTLADPRFAISFAPRRWSPLGRFGRRWLGRDCSTGAAVERLVLPGFSAADLAALTAGPARFGWHAPLAPPFRLKQATTTGDLVAHAMNFAAARLPFEIPALALERGEGSLALVALGAPPLLLGLAEDCRRAFGPLSAARDRAASARRGNPFAREAFRFRILLASPLAAAEGERLKAALEEQLAGLLDRALAVDAISIFVEPAPGEDFRELRRIPFAGAG